MVDLRDLIIDRGLLRQRTIYAPPGPSTQITDLSKLGRNRQLTIQDYLYGGCLKVDIDTLTIGVSVGVRALEVTRAVMAARNLRGLDDKPIEMPEKFSTYRGLLLEVWDPLYVCVYALTPTMTTITAWRKHVQRGKALAAARECYSEDFRPVDGIPEELHLIKSKSARQNALDAYETVRSQ